MFVYCICLSGQSYLATTVSSNTCCLFRLSKWAELSGYNRQFGHNYVWLLRLFKWAELSGYKREFEHVSVYSVCLSGRSSLATSVSSNRMLFTPPVSVGGVNCLKARGHY